MVWSSKSEKRRYAELIDKWAQFIRGGEVRELLRDRSGHPTVVNICGMPPDRRSRTSET